MKITKRELKELLREQVKTVVDEVWIKVGDDEPPLPSHSEHGPYAPEEGEELPGPGDRPAWEDDASHPDSPDYEEEEGGVVDLRGQKPITRQSIARLKHRIKQHTGEEPVDLGTWDPRTGKVRVKESDLKDMIRATLEEVMGEALPMRGGESSLDRKRMTDGAFSRKEKERQRKKEEEEAKKKAQAELEEEKKDDDSFSDAGKEIEKKGTEGVFTKKAKKRGMTAQEFARKVLANTDEYDLKTVRQASFAKGADTVAKKNKKK